MEADGMNDRVILVLNESARIGPRKDKNLELGNFLPTYIPVKW